MVARDQSMVLPSGSAAAAGLLACGIDPSKGRSGRSRAGGREQRLAADSAPSSSSVISIGAPVWPVRSRLCKLNQAIKRNLLPIQSSRRPTGQRTIPADRHVPLNFRPTSAGSDPPATEPGSRSSIVHRRRPARARQIITHLECDPIREQSCRLMRVRSPAVGSVTAGGAGAS